MEENLYTPNCIRAYSGAYVNIINPNPDTIIIEDIAHALSMQCRFGGHLNRFFSVAEHSVFCYRIADDYYRLDALLHDASEAYLMDLPSPVKKLLPGYYEFEDNFMKVISAKFGFNYPLITEVKMVDNKALEHEWDKYMLSAKSGLKQEDAEDQFLEAFYTLKNG